MLIILSLLILTSVFLVRDKLLKNTNELGVSLAKSYAAEEKYRLQTIEDIVVVSSEFIDEILENGGSGEDIHLWLQDYFKKLKDVNESTIFSPYAVIDGKIIAADYWEGDSTYDYESQPWYKDAINANGELIITDAYVDAITGEYIYTISKEISREGDVVAVDIFSNMDEARYMAQNLPQGTSIYFADSQNTLVYFTSPASSDRVVIQGYFDRLAKGIYAGKYDEYDSIIKGVNGENRGVYYNIMDNGWIVVLTIPLEQILMEDQNVIVNLLAILGIISFIIISIIVIRDIKRSKGYRKVENTIFALGESYYAIYRVNFIDGIYEEIKNSLSEDEHLDKKGPYIDLLNKVKSVAKEKTFEEFYRNYSLPSIRTRVREGVKDFGGDYQRLWNNEYRWVNVRTIYDKDLDPNEVILCFKDVNEEKKHQMQNIVLLQDAIEAANKSVKAKSDFFSCMSHDMRTPLNAILGFSEIALANINNTEKVKDYLQNISVSGKQMLTLVNDILEISKIEAGKNKLDYKKIDLMDKLKETINIFKLLSLKENKIFTTSVDIENNTVICDGFKICQIINNILSNAFKYSSEGAEIKLEIKQFGFEKFSKFQFIVTDTGIGMSKEFTKRIFDPYTRETAFTDGSIVGTGLGMSIVKSLVNQMSGEISVESEIGKGTCFTVTIPMETVPNEDESESLSENNSRDINLENYTILLAEDNELNREIATELLNLKKCKVIVAEDGKKAFEIFAGSPLFSIDAILMDMQMPIMDGCESALLIRNLDREDAKTVPIIAVTANAFAEDIDKTTKAGMNAHISKPIDASVLYKTLYEQIVMKN